MEVNTIKMDIMIKDMYNEIVDIDPDIDPDHKWTDNPQNWLSQIVVMKENLDYKNYKTLKTTVCKMKWNVLEDKDDINIKKCFTLYSPYSWDNGFKIQREGILQKYYNYFTTICLLGNKNWFQY